MYREPKVQNDVIHATYYGRATFCGLVIWEDGPGSRWLLPAKHGHTLSYNECVSCPQCLEKQEALTKDSELQKAWYKAWE